jgi:hypothetical protein
MSRAWPSDNQDRAVLLFSCSGCSRSFALARSVARWDTVASALGHAYANVVRHSPSSLLPPGLRSAAAAWRSAIKIRNPKLEIQNKPANGTME